MSAGQIYLFFALHEKEAAKWTKKLWQNLWNLKFISGSFLDDDLWLMTHKWLGVFEHRKQFLINQRRVCMNETFS